MVLKGGEGRGIRLAASHEIPSGERRARAPLPAAAHVDHGVEVVDSKIIETGRLVGVVTTRLVVLLLLY